MEPYEGIVDLVPELKRCNVHRILDLGCGAGRHTLYLAREGFFVVGLDSSAEALNISEERLRKDNIRNCCLIDSDMTKLPFPDGHFDAVVSTNVIHHNTSAGIEKTVGEIRRIVRPGGLVFLTILSTAEYETSDMTNFKSMDKDTWEHTSGDHMGVPHRFFDEKGARALFSGFKVVNMNEKKCKERVHWHILAQRP